ncbi:glycoside hydrolase family 3 N-terminal domain-containing protein [Robiginitalea sp. IMCC44478]|uniref:glycoside hydrolase family 3 N-terminal domain-containing protein n=1 Tax=Robiginitalea sp. IMCC44478 TaxID=3459122 RepID=UPI00404344C7
MLRKLLSIFILKRPGKALVLFLAICCVFYSNAQEDPLQSVDSLQQAGWVNQRYASMSPEQRIGQLFMVMATSDRPEAELQKISRWIRDYHIGGLIFSTGGPVRQARMTNRLQQLSSTPLLIGMDAEWGLAMRLDSTFAYPWNTTLGAIEDSTLLEQIGYRIGEQAKRLGVHINFAPVVDINTNPDNPIIGNRSFGEDPEKVSWHARLMMKGMQRAGILSCAKHFPGHGDTAVDSHKALPQILFERQRLDSVELLPFRRLSKQGLSSVMIAHLNVPALTGSETEPTSLSSRMIETVLKEQLGFKGLILTDALNMKGVTGYTGEKNTSLTAFLAGNDMLLMPPDLDQDFPVFLEAYKNGTISEARLERSVKKILKAKYKAGLHQIKPIAIPGLFADLNQPADSLLYEKTMEGAITVLQNKVDILGIKRLENKKIAYVKLGDAPHLPFLERLQQYADVTEVSANDIASLSRKLEEFNLVIIGMHQSNESPWKKHAFTEKERFWLEEISRMRSSNVILTVFARPYILRDILSYENIDGLVMAYQNSKIAQQTAAEMLFGVFPARGKLPVSAHSSFPAGSGLQTAGLKRLGYSIPERVGFDRYKLARVDSLVQDGLDSLMFPGAQVLISRKGQVVYHKAFGKPAYDAEGGVKLTDVYDLASLTKILATLPLLMQMEERGQIRLNATFGDLSPELAESELKNVTVLKALSHYGRLPSWIAFYLDTLGKNRQPSSEFYRNKSEAGFSIKVAERLYLTDAYKDSIYDRIARQSLKSNRYRYSDVAYYVFKKYIEETLQKPLNLLADEALYKPLGASRTLFNPLKTLPKEEIIPTELDNYYRYQKIQGYVHDMGAAMQGGVGGHAGLFSNANDVAKIMQMYLQGGYYGGSRLIESRTVEKFNKCYFCDKNVRRGVGFDKPQLEDPGPTCGCVSRKSFGHSGFTGTYTWADPETEIVYVFLSNRTYPSSTNTLLIRSGLRTRIQQAIYDSLISSEQN